MDAILTSYFFTDISFLQKLFNFYITKKERKHLPSQLL